MSDRLKPLIQRAVLDIVEYDYQTRTEMVQLDRRMPFCVMSYLKRGEALLRIRAKSTSAEAEMLFLCRRI